MDKQELCERLTKIIRELVSIENDDEEFMLTIEEISMLCDMRRKLRRIVEKGEKS